jgi:hypothetical protein
MFTVYAHIPDQQYCSERQCQNKRRQKWRKQKMTSDKDYQANQYDAQKRWCRKNQDYWRRYRDQHPDYVKRNRQLQRLRNGGASADNRVCEPIAKRYALPAKKTDISGYYKLIPADNQLIANSDVLLVKLDFISNAYPKGP